MVCVADVSESARLREELEHQATIDPLTGCRSRAATVRFLSDVLDRAIPCAAVFIDINGFKKVNDHHGHAAGDELLADIAARVLGALRPGEIVGRIGGDEFLLVCPAVADPAAALATPGCAPPTRSPSRRPAGPPRSN